MNSVHTGMWDPRPLSKHASPIPPPHPPNSRLAHVTSAAPAKRITFYKSGDSQFGGVRMAVHKRSFKCFDALLDDLSQKVPLPFGVRTVTTPRGTHTINHLEQLQDGGCYLCSDRRHAKPVNMELARKRPNMWYHETRRPHRPETSSTTPPGHTPHRSRRILLVKNSEPGMRRSIVLNRRSTRSLRAFLDEVSEVMQYHVRKLYTAEGRRIDSVQSLMTCPGVLVCVGREAFSPMLINYIRKSSEEKLPGLGNRSPGLGPRTPGNGARSPATQGVRSPPHGAQSRASEYSEGQESKRNVNFGLETKKSIIHPRSDSSNRSTRFSLSSEKSYGNGVSAYSQAKPSIMNEDIEKRVLVNKDGSLSVEMRVRFRLHNEETLQWSTQIKKSPSLTNDCCPLSQAQPNYLLQGQSESCSDPDSTVYDPEGVDYSSQPLHHMSEGNHCSCCYQRQERQYDLWENPAHSRKQPPVPPPQTSSHTHTMIRHTHSSSSSSSCNSRRVVRCRAKLSTCGGGSGSEQSQVVQEEVCVTEEVERRVEVEQDGDTHVEVCSVSRCRSTRPLSAVSNSSHVLQELREDQDDDLSPTGSVSAASEHCNPCQGCEVGEVSRPVSEAGSCQCGDTTTHPTAEVEDGDQAQSRASCRSSRAKPPNSEEEEEGAADDEDEELKRVVSCGSGCTGESRASSVCPDCGGYKRGANSESHSRTSTRSQHSQQASPKPVTPLSNPENSNNGSDDDSSGGSAVSTQSNKSNLTNHGRLSAISQVLEERGQSAMSSPEAAGDEGERAPSATSARSQKSSRSHKSGCNGSTDVPAEKEERSLSAMSAQSGKSHKSTSNGSAEVQEAVEEGEINKRSLSALCVQSNGRPDSVLSAKSAKSNVSAKSGKSKRSTCSRCAGSVSPGAKVADEPVTDAAGQDEGKEVEERASSAMSAKSNLTAKSHGSHKSNKASERSLSPRSETGGDAEGRTASQMSGRSVKSNKSSKSCNQNDKEGETCPSPVVEEEKEEIQQRSESVMSAKLENEDNEKTEASPEMGDDTEETGKAEDHDTSSRVASPARVPSAMSGKSHTSAKSSKSRKSESSLNPNGGKKQSENEERVASALSVKSKSSLKSGVSNKSSSSKRKPNTVTIRTPDGDDDGGGEMTERAQSAASAKSGKSEANGDEKAEGDDAPEPSQSPVIQLLPDEGVGGARGPSALSVRSATSAKSGRSKCSCGAAERAKKAKEREDEKELKGEEVSERSASAVSSSTKRQRKESGGTEEALSRKSSGSVSLGLPEDQDTGDSDSGKSSVSFHTNTESKGRVKTRSPDVEGTGSIKSHGSTSKISAKDSSPNPPAVNIPTIETPGGGSEDKGEEDRASALSARSSRSHKSSCNCSVNAESVKSASTTKASNKDAPETRTLSPMSSASAKVRNKSPASVKNVAKSTAGDSENNNSANQADSRPSSKADITDNKVETASCSLRPESAASAQSGSKMKAKKVKVEEPAERHKPKSTGSVKSQKKETAKASSPCPIHSSRPCSRAESSLSNSLSAADLLKETMAARPSSQQSHVTKTSDKARSKKRGSSQRSRNKTEPEEEEELDLSPACLPNASPTEVVSDWLRSIPANSSMLALGDGQTVEVEEPNNTVEEIPEEVAEKEEPSPEGEKVGEEEKEKEEEEGECKEEKSPDPAPEEAVETSQPKSIESLPRNWNSSAAVMKVLLSSSLGRCQSMPEVSPVYGRRLSTSARGLLDCLAQLQLIEPAVSPGFDQQKGHNQQYEDIMTILQSLWLTDPRNIEMKDNKDGMEQVSPPRSSSGVGMSSGSAGSGKENGNQVEDETKQISLHEDEGVEKVLDDEGNAVDENKEHQAETVPEEAAQSEEQNTVAQSQDSPKATENPSSSDKSSPNDSSKSPTDNEREAVEDSSSGTPPTVLRASLSKKLSQDPDPVWILHLLKKLEKQFMNHYINAMAEFKVRWDLDDSLILDTMISELRDEVSRRIQSSIEREMKKIQSRAGKGGRSPRPPQGKNLSRESTMTEKRRRMLKVMKNQSVKTADSLSDEEMTGDLSDQRSDDEYCPCDACVRKKMAARPFVPNPNAAELPVMMEFDLLKILQMKKSPSPVSTVSQPAEVEEDVVLEEEGRNLEVVQEEEEEEETKEDIRADVILEETIPEEDEEVGDGEEAKGEEEKGENNAGEEEAVRMDTLEKIEEEEEEEEEAVCTCQCGQNEEENKEAEEEEEGEGETAEGGDAEQSSDKGGEDETKDDEVKEEEETEGGTGEEESEKETVKEATTGVEETTENSQGEEGGEEEEEKEAEEEEGGGPDGEPAEEEEEGGETTEEASGEAEEENAAREETNEESMLVEDNVEGNISASAEAEDEDEGEDVTEEGESQEEEKGGESEEQEGAASEEERTSPQGQGVTEGEEADAEDSDTDHKPPNETSVDESGREGAEAGDEDEGEEVAEESKPEDEKEEEEEGSKREALLHQYTRTSVESQPGSLEDIDTDSPQNPVPSIEVPKVVTEVSSGGGTGNRRSRSPARVKRRKPKESDVELDDI